MDHAEIPSSAPESSGGGLGKAKAGAFEAALHVGKVRHRSERLAWIALLIFNLAAHFAILGSRTMTHDEGIHAYSSYTYWRDHDYRHDPAYHGPLLYHMNAAVYALIGDDDASARLVPALAGMALIVVLFLARPLLGRRVAFAAAILASLSPTLLYYGRYIRNDIYEALFYLVWTLAAFAYLRSGNFRWLWGVSIPMALGFASKEVTFIFGVTIGSFFLLLGLWERRKAASASATRALDLAFWILTLALPFASPALAMVGGADPGAYASGSISARFGWIGLSVAIAIGVAALRFRRKSGARTELRGGLGLRTWLLHFALFWSVEIALFTSLFTNVSGGIFSGVLGSLGYWLGQQGVGRGSQPIYYYVLLALLYELLTVILLLTAGWVLARRTTRRLRAGSLLASRLALPSFALWWALASWVGYSWAGEKMPWLLVHIVLPMCLLGGWGSAMLVAGIRRRGSVPLRALAVFGGLVPLIVACGVSMFDLPLPAIGEGAARSLAFAMRGGLVLGVAAIAWRLRQRLPQGLAWRLTAAGALVFLGLWELRASLRANFVNYDLATEPIDYALASPDVKRALQEIEDLEQRLGTGEPIEVSFDDEVTWPMLWYLRHQPSSRFAPDPRGLSAANAVVLVGKKNFPQAEAIFDRTHVRRDYRLVWWPYEGYQGLTVERLWRILTTPEELRWLWKVVAYREYEGVTLGEWYHRNEFRLYIDRQLAAQAWPLGFEALERLAVGGSGAASQRPLWCEAEVHFEGPFAGAKLLEPAAVAAWGDGGVAIADTGNHRIVLLRAVGSVERVLGGGCELARGASGGCLDPDGPEGPLPLGAGQFWQPWGVAVSAAGDVAVADTWNGRVQVFDAAGRLLWIWGRSAFEPGTEPAMDRLFGPRAIAFDPSGERIVVADTGNKRLVVLSRSGEFLQEITSPGTELGGFAEPIGLAFRPADGALLVADTWNQRVLEADASLSHWRIAADSLWPRKTGATTPYLAIESTGRLLLSDPDRDRLILNSDDTSSPTTSIFGRFGALSMSDPVGLAFTSVDRLWVASRRDGTIYRFLPLSECQEK